MAVGRRPTCVGGRGGHLRQVYGLRPGLRAQAVEQVFGDGEGAAPHRCGPEDGVVLHVEAEQRVTAAIDQHRQALVPHEVWRKLRRGGAAVVSVRGRVNGVRAFPTADVSGRGLRVRTRACACACDECLVQRTLPLGPCFVGTSLITYRV